MPWPPDDLARRLAAETLDWPLTAYRAALTQLPTALQDDLAQAWGAPESDPACRDGAFHFAALRCGRALVALQPERGEQAQRDEAYHDLSRCPRHGYVAFYLWLRAQRPMRWSMWARTARWNGCRARPWPCPPPAGPRR
jgi:cobaltochelatase CobN